MRPARHLPYKIAWLRAASFFLTFLSEQSIDILGIGKGITFGNIAGPKDFVLGPEVIGVKCKSSSCLLTVLFLPTNLELGR